MPPRHLLLVNPSAGVGRSRKLLGAAREELDRAGIEHRLVLTRDLEHGVAEARAAVEAGERVIVMSGDGLIGQVGGALAGTDAVLGIIPAGRGNDLARVLGIPTDVRGAVAAIVAGRLRTIDVGEANGARFLCIASCGFDSVVNERANETRILRGPLVYAYAALRTLAFWKTASFTLTLDGERVALRGYSVVAANSKAYGGGMYIAPDASLDDGLVDVVVTGEGSKLAFLRGLPMVFKGEHVNRPEVRVWRVKEVRIESDRPFKVFADGDPITELPATVRVLPAALRVIVPPEAAP
ncbi:MAG TPA: diacylglycerol kinase family protein [Solirubrobacterales bacterium]|jgi:YegS/Rv2252/BmrU family lipid kinase